LASPSARSKSVDREELCAMVGFLGGVPYGAQSFRIESIDRPSFVG
jgi:hypothetical protein